MKRKNVEIGEEVSIGKKVRFGDDVHLLGECYIGDNCVIESGSLLFDVVLGEGCVVHGATVQRSYFYKNCEIGAFSKIANCTCGYGLKTEKFVEIDGAYVAEDCHIGEHSKLANCSLGRNVKIGSGVSFESNDKKIVVGSNVNIEANCKIVAPVEIADGTHICAGTTVKKNTNKNDFVLGREHQENISRQSAK